MDPYDRYKWSYNFLSKWPITWVWYVPPWTSWHEVFWLMRPVAIAGASGGFASLVLTVLRDSILQGGAGDPFTCPVCPDLGLLTTPQELDWFSLLVGVLIGLIIGPVVDLLFIARQLWAERLRRLLRRPADRTQFKVLG